MSLWQVFLVVTAALLVVGGIAAIGMVLNRKQLEVRDWLVHVVAFALSVVVVAEVALIFGRGAACFMRGGCTTEEVTGTFETMTGLIGTLIALLFAVLKGPDGGDKP